MVYIIYNIYSYILRRDDDISHRHCHENSCALKIRTMILYFYRYRWYLNNNNNNNNTGFWWTNREQPIRSAFENDTTGNWKKSNFG